ESRDREEQVAHRQLDIGETLRGQAGLQGVGAEGAERDAEEPVRPRDREQPTRHRRGSARKGRTAASDAAGCRRFTTWSASSMSTTRAPGMPAAIMSLDRALVGGS